MLGIVDVCALSYGLLPLFEKQQKSSAYYCTFRFAISFSKRNTLKTAPGLIVLAFVLFLSVKKSLRILLQAQAFQDYLTQPPQS